MALSKSKSEARAAAGTRRKPRLLVLTSHAIQYQAPLFRAMAKDERFDTHVALCSDQGATSYRDAGFGADVKWDVPLLQGYDLEVMGNVSPRPDPSHIFGLINPGIVRKIWSGQFDALMLQSWSNATTWLALLAAWVKGLPIILKPEANIYSHKRGWKRVLKRFLLINLFRKMAMVLAPGRYGVDFFQHYRVPDERIKVAPYAVDNDFFAGKAKELRPQRDRLRLALAVSGGTPLIIFVGKIYPGKRPADLLQAFAKVRQKASAALIFVGDGESRASLEQVVASEHIPDVHFMGFRNQSELPEFLTAADIFVLPSALETWGLVVNEAMCFSLPVICTDRVGAGGDLVHHGENGFVYPVGDVEKLAEHLLTLVQDAPLRRRMGDLSQQMIEKWSYREDIEAIAASLESVIHR